MLTVQIVGDTTGLDQALGKSTSGISAFGRSISVGGIAKVAAMAGVVGIAVGAVAELTSAAAADRAEQDKLALAIRNATGSTEDYTAATDAAIAAGQARAFSDTETRDALASLVTATKDVDSATALLATSQDIARAANVDLATAADAVAKAQQGQDGSLRRLLPGLAEGATATDTIANAQRQAAGAADQYAASSEGQAARTTDAFGELAEELGGALLPILDALLPALLPIIAQLGELMRAVLPILIPLIESLAAGLKLGLGIWTGIANIVSQKVIPALTPVIALMQRLVDEILPVLTGLIQGLGDAFDTVAGFVQSAADAIGDIVQAAQDALGVIGDLLGELGKITDFELPDVVGGITDALPDLWSAPAPTPEAPQAGVRGSSRQAGRAGGSVQVNIIGDPMTIERTVVRALRTHYRRAGRFPAELGSVA